jgi:PAS domain S-box-containing protein
MSIVEPQLDLLRDPRLSALAISARPVWLWSVDGTHILWANAAAAAIFRAPSSAASTTLRFARTDAIAAQVLRLAATLPPREQERLERLRGFGASFGRTLTCACSRIVISGNGAAVLIAAVEPAGPTLSLAERIARLLPETHTSFAVFTADGGLIYANAAARRDHSGIATLAGLGATELGAAALKAGHAMGTVEARSGRFAISARALGDADARLLLISWPSAPAGNAVADAAPQFPPQQIPWEPNPPQQTPQPAPPEPAAPEQVWLAQSAPVETAPEKDITPAAELPVQGEPQVEAQVDAQIENPAGSRDEAEAQPPIEAPAQAVSEPGPPPFEPIPEPGSAPAAAAASPSIEEPTGERRHPLRFVWHMDAEGRFGIGSDEFVELVGPRTMAAFGRPWSEIATELKLDPAHQISRAVASRETWSGLVVSWPVDDADERLPVELSGLPVFDRERGFRGYRGFGVCRDLERINKLARARHDLPPGFAGAPPAADLATQPPKPAPDAEQPAEAPSTEPESLAKPELRPDVTAADAGTPVAAPANVVPFRPSPPLEPKMPPPLSPVERRAFRELAQELTARLREPQASATSSETRMEDFDAAATETEAPPPAPEPDIGQILLDRLPIGILLYRHDALLFANRHFLDWSGFENLAEIETAGGVNRLFAGPPGGALAQDSGQSTYRSFALTARSGERLPAEGRLFTVPWSGGSALALVLTNGRDDATRRASEAALDEARNEIGALRSALEATADGIVTLDAKGTVVGANAGAGALFGKTADALVGRPLSDLLTRESETVARDFLARFTGGHGTLDSVLNVEIRRGERAVPLSVTLSPIGGERFCAILRDVSAQRRMEEELRNAKREAMRASAIKAEFLSKVSHEIRTPLNAMTGFAEVIMAERFGPIGNERYREYVKDIHAAGAHLVSLLNDLLDLSKVEAGQVELNFSNLNLNELTQQCVGIMQPEANRARIIIRMSLTPGLPQIVADERSLRQITLNLLSNAIRFTGPGGQVIVSTVLSDAREALLRVRDTGAGMSEKDIQTALEPFAQSATSGSWGSGGASFGLPLTKALAEANRAHFSIKSAPNAGTLIEIAFPPNRIVAA